MKRILSFVAGLMMIATLSFAARNPAGEGTYLGLGVGLDFPGYNWWSGSPTGLGGQVFAGYAFGRSTAIQLGLDGAVYSYSNGNSTFDLYVLPEFKYTFDTPGLQPYLLAGAGLNLSFNSGSGTSDSAGYFAGVLGGGVQFDMGGDTSLFVQGELHMAFVSVSGSSDVADDFPFTAGLKFPM